ncbi:hypothetical protein MNB_SV-4-884 [hydrothermal vent metagenome]|uniref:YMGG-like Gly-zipper domain-containing protein n=1 Tax=hydrothermal vent metagenome TaxID=652676 RepID=A0A1W1E9I6_9ZZZZ
MHYKIYCTLLFTAVSLLLAGCTGNEAVPANATQTGITAGALAGSVIGYNEGHHHRGRDAALGALAGAAAGGLIGSAVDKTNQQPVQTGGWHE